MKLDVEGGDYRLAELSSLVVGKKLGTGRYRRVYEHATDSSCVIKVQRGFAADQNIAEWTLWNNTPAKYRDRWLVPCVAISRGGLVLIMKYAKQMYVRDGVLLPAKIPRILNQDSHCNNWSLYKGKVMCHDYAMLNFTNSKPWELVPHKW